jgi:hypothetical protein
MYGNDLENHKVDVDDVIGKWCVKAKVIAINIYRKLYGF